MLALGHEKQTQTNAVLLGWLVFRQINLPSPRERLSFTGGSDGKESDCNAGEQSLSPGLGRSPRGEKRQPTPVFLPGKFYGQRRLAGYSPWGHKELDTTEQLTHKGPLQYSCLENPMDGGAW